MRSRTRVFVPMLLVGVCAGCFRYTPASVSDVAPGETVRARVSREQARQFEGMAGLQGRELVGRVVSTDPERLMLEVRAVALEQGNAGRTLNQRVAVPLSEVMDLELRTISVWKTTLVTVGITAAVGGLLALQLYSGENSPSRNDKNPPDALRRAPEIRVQIPLPLVP